MLGDLTSPHWESSRFLGTWQNGALCGVAILYDGFPGVRILDYHGAPEALDALRAAVVAAGEVHYILHPDAYQVFKDWYEPIAPVRMWRMVVPPDRFMPCDVAAERLRPEDAPALRALFDSRVDALDERLLARGAFYGVRVDGHIVSVAGTHVFAPGEGVAALGYVFTAPAHRGKGCATACTAAVTRAALEAGIETIVLNVAQENAPAIAAYRRVGYGIYCPLVEGRGVPRS